MNFTNPNGHTVVARFRKIPAAAPTFEPVRSRGSTAPNASIRRSSLSRSQSQRRQSRLRSGRLPLHRPRRWRFRQRSDHRAQNLSTLLGKMLRIDVNVPDNHPTGYGCRPTIPSSARPAPIRPEIWDLAAQPVALQLRRCGAWRHRRAGHRRRRARTRSRRSTTSRADAAAATTAGASAKARTTTSRRPPALQTADRSDLRIRPTLGASVTGGFVYRGRSLGSQYRGRYFFADFFGRVWSLGLTLDANGEARVNGVIEHTTELGGSQVLGKHQFLRCRSGWRAVHRQPHPRRGPQADWRCADAGESADYPVTAGPVRARVEQGDLTGAPQDAKLTRDRPRLATVDGCVPVCILSRK